MTKYSMHANAMHTLIPMIGYRGDSWRLIVLAPVACFLVFLLLAPLVGILQGAIAGGAGSFAELRDNTTLFRVMQNTIVVSVITAVLTTMLGYLIAFSAWRSESMTVRIVIFAFVLLPFWTDVMVKNFAFIVLLRHNGIINNVLIAAGLIDQPLQLLHTRWAVIVGMVHYTLPYAVFPIFAVMMPLDKRLDRAAESLGASRWARARHVLFPLTLSGTLAAGLLSFIISVGFFITPILLGGPRDRMVSNTIEYYQTELVDFNTAAMLAVGVSIAVTMLVIAYQRIPTESQYGES